MASTLYDIPGKLPANTDAEWSILGAIFLDNSYAGGHQLKKFHAG